MASMRRLNRRLARWVRYAARTYWSPRHTRPAWASRSYVIAPGHTRAWAAVEDEAERRRCRAYNPFPGGQCVCGGCVSVGPCEYEPAEDPRCCRAGDDGHPGQCVVGCDECNGDGRCPDCGGEDDMGCRTCDGNGACPRGCDHGEVVLEEWTPAYIPAQTTTAFQEAGLL
jgi:hypothetical protein